MRSTGLCHFITNVQWMIFPTRCHPQLSQSFGLARIFTNNYSHSLLLLELFPLGGQAPGRSISGSEGGPPCPPDLTYAYSSQCLANALFWIFCLTKAQCSPLSVSDKCSVLGISVDKFPVQIFLLDYCQLQIFLSDI